MKVGLGNCEKSARWFQVSSPVGIRRLIQFAAFFLIFSIPYETEAIQIEFLGAEKLRLLEKPRYLDVCHRHDKKVDQCIKSSLEKFMKSVNSGSSEYVLPSIDPIEIPLLEFRKGSGNVSLEIVFKEMIIHGFKTFKISVVRSNLSENKFEISMTASYLEFESEFTAQGGIFTFPISGEGNFSLNLTDVLTNLIIHLGTSADISGVDYLTTEKVIMNLLPTDINGHFGNFIDGSNEIGAAFNDFFNLNALEIFEAIRPEVEDVLEKIVKAIADEILSRHPAKTLLPD